MILYLIKAYFRSILKNRGTIYWSIQKNGFKGFMLKEKEVIFFYNIIDFVDFFLYLANSKDKKIYNLSIRVLKKFYEHYEI
ncbi:MAG: hypothetical protein RL027_622 [Pseudomonadota bacterium]|jgi:hypothetical protein